MSSEPPALRASHEDRERAVEALQAAAGDGRITPGELDIRVEIALSAITINDLAALTADLPPLQPTSLPASDILVIEQEGGRYQKTGRWVLPKRIEIRTKLCKVTLDLAQAVAPDGLLRVNADMKLGKLIFITTPGIDIDTSGLALAFSKVKLVTTGDTACRLRVEVVGRLNNAKIIEARQ